MSGIPTWHQRAMAHPDHQSGMISEGMIRARMCEEIDDLRAEIERLRADNERMHNVLYRIARKRPFVHNPWALARAEVEGKP